MTRRGLAPVVGVALLVLVSLALAGVVLGAVSAVDPGEPPPRAAFELDADAGADRVAVTHAGGDALDPATVDVRIEIDGRALDAQPPVPFFSARGFRPGPTGPFNAAWEDDWSAGETGSVRVASTNSPGGIDRGEQVRVAVSVDGSRIADETAIA